MKVYTEKINVRLPLDLMTTLKAFAAEKNIPPSTLARTLLTVAIFGQLYPNKKRRTAHGL